MKVRKAINFYDLILFEKVKLIYNEKYDGVNENKILTDIYNRLNNKFLKLELEDGKEINDIKYIKIEVREGTSKKIIKVRMIYDTEKNKYSYDYKYVKEK